jgi:hypothetical protein
MARPNDAIDSEALTAAIDGTARRGSGTGADGRAERVEVASPLFELTTKRVGALRDQLCGVLFTISFDAAQRVVAIVPGLVAPLAAGARGRSRAAWIRRVCAMKALTARSGSAARQLARLENRAQHA